MLTPLIDHPTPQGEKLVPNDRSFSTGAISPFWITPFVSAISPLENPAQIKKQRRMIARMKTELRWRELDRKSVV